MPTEIATFAAGCFWGVEEAFRQLPGVVDTEVGFMGGQVEDPSYEEVCQKETGHAEVCQVTYDPEKTSYEALLDAFWQMHDPTQVNRQGPDVGDQYRSLIFFHTPDQQAAASVSKEKLAKSGRYHAPIATRITPASAFYPAEEYHQRYIEKRGGGACHI